MRSKTEAAGDVELRIEDEETPLKVKKIPRPAGPVPMSQQGDIPLASMLPGAGGNVFCLARIAMIRALQIHEGSKPLIECTADDKVTSIALREIAQGKVAYKK